MTPFGESAMRPSFIVAVAASMFAGQTLAQAPAPVDQNPSGQNLDSAPPVLLIIPEGDNSSPSADAPAEPRAQSKESEPSAPRAGASTITEDEAKATFESQGFSQVTELKKNDDGVWIGKAERDGGSFEVALDFEGNVFYRAAS